MNFRRFLRRLFSFSQIQPISRKQPRLKNKPLSARVGLEHLEDRFNPTQLFWPDLTVSTGGFPTQVVLTLDTNSNGKLDSFEDLNGDGNVDFAAATANGITIGLGNGDATFQPSKTFTLGSNPTSLAFGDFNGDNKLDIVASQPSTNRISILFGDGSGGFSAGPNIEVGSQPKFVAVGDFDGKNGPDIVTADFASSGISVLINNGNGTGTFAEKIQYSIKDSFPNSIAVGQFTNDGNLDLLVGLSGLNKVALYKGTGNSLTPFLDDPDKKTEPTLTDLKKSPNFIVAQDFNKDGLTDFATANPVTSDVSIFLGQGKGIFAEKQVKKIVTGQDKGPQSLAAGDLNGDGVLDLATSNRFGASTSILLGNSDGTFKDPTQYATGNFPISVGLADLNNDKKADALIANFDDSTLSILTGMGNGALNSAQTHSLGASPSSIASGDFNKDGFQDLVTANSAGQSISLFFGNGNGTYKLGQAIPVGLHPNEIVVADLNGDKIPDIATVNSGDNTISALKGLGDGTFVIFDLNNPIITGANPKGLVTGDFNGDNVLDLAATNFDDNSVSLFLGNGSGTFQSGIVSSVGSGPTGLTVGNFNKDANGALDLAVTNSTGKTVSVLIGNKDGSFEPQIEYQVGSRPLSVETTDINGDQILDLITANNESNNLSILLGNKGGSFDKATELNVGLSPGKVIARDANNDNIADLLVTEIGGNSLSVLIASGNGKFKAPIGYTVGSGPTSLVLDNIDNKNGLDIVTANSMGSSVSTLLGIGDGTFQAPLALTTAFGPYALATADFNGDGKPDLATANNYDNNITVLLNTGKGTFASGVSYPPDNSAPVSISAGDINLDGLPDLAVANNGGDGFSLFLNDSSKPGTFKPQNNVTSGINPNYIEIRDLNNDKKPDVIVANQGSNNLTIHFGKGDGTFENSVTTLSVDAPQSFFIADINNDKVDDILVGSLTGNLIIFKGNSKNGLPDGTFTKDATSIKVGAAPFSVSGGNFNGDNRLDLIIADASSNELDILLSAKDDKGNDIYQSKYLSSGASPYAVKVGDFDGDGNTDVASVNSNGNNVALFFGLGNGTFEAPLSAPVGANPFDLVIGDFDGDRRVDFATANFNGSNVSVLLNSYNLSPKILNTDKTGIKFKEGQAVQFQINAQGSPKPTFSLTGSLPDGLTLNTDTGLISGSPAVGTAREALYAFKITAQNGQGSDDTQDFSFQIDPGNGIAPKITSPASTNFLYGTKGSFTVIATGTPAPTFSITAGALPGGITLDPVTGLLSGKTNAGTYNFTITASNNVNPSASQPFTLTVDQAALTITAENKTKVYGAKLPTLTTVVTGLVNGDTEASITGLGATTLATAKSNVGDYKINPTGTNSNYKITLVDGTLSVTKAGLTITAENKSKVYGADLPPLTTVVTGLVNGDTESSISGLGASTVATKSSKVGDYKITAAGTSGNYDIKFVDGTLTVTKAALKITAEDKTKVYGDALPTLTTQVTGLVNGDTTASITGLKASTSATASSKVGDYKITAAGTNSNYDITLVDGTLSVTKAPLTIAAENKTKVYGAAVPALTTKVTGLVNGDTIASINGLAATTLATKNSKVGDYVITPAGTNSNYDIKLTPGNLSVTKAALTITPNSFEKVKGTTYTFTGLEFTTSAFALDSDKVTKLTLTSPGAADTAALGKYDISGSNPVGTGLDNYDITFGKGTLTVVPINTAPSGIDNSITVDEDNSYTFKSNDFPFTDVDNDKLLSIVFSGLPTAKGSLKLNGADVNNKQEIKIGDITSGLLIFTPGKDENGTPYSTLKFQVRDDGGTVNNGVNLDPTPKTLTLNVRAINDAPTVNAPTSFTVTEDVAGNLVYTGTPFADVDNTNLTVVLTVEDGKLAALPQTGLTITGSGTNKLSVVGTTAALNGYFTKAGNLTYLTAQDNNVSKTLTTTVSDGLLSGSDTSVINITAVNDAPTVNAPTSFAVTEDVAGNLLYSGTPFVDVDSPTLTVTLSIADGVINALTTTGLTISGNSSAKVTIAGTTPALNAYFTKAGNITYTTALNNNAARVLTTTASDGSLTGSDTSTINITPVNDAPVLTVPASFQTVEDTPKTLVFAPNSVTDVDSNSILLTISADTSKPFGILQAVQPIGLPVSIVTNNGPTIRIAGSPGALSAYLAAANGNILFTPPTNITTPQILTVSAEDNTPAPNTGKASVQTTINITPVNDAPTVNAPASFTVTEDVATNLTYVGTTFTDVDSPNLTVTLSIADGVISTVASGDLTISGNSSAKVTIAGTTSALNAYFAKAGNITYTTALNNNVARVLTTTASDGSLTGSDTSTINITPVNDAPVLTVPASFQTVEDTPKTLVFAPNSVTDVDSNSILLTISADTSKPFGILQAVQPIGLPVSIVTNNGPTIRIAGSPGALSAYLAAANGNIRFSPPTNITTPQILTVSAEDNTPAPNTGKASVQTTINITPVNDAPTVNAPASFTVTEDVATNLTYVGTTFTDVDSPNLTVTLSIADGVINTVASGDLTISGNTSAKVTIAGTTSALNAYFAKAGNITYTTALNNNVARVLTTTASDGSLTGSDTSTINITPVNDAPTVTAPTTFTVTEDVAGNLVYTGTPFADVDNTNLTVVLTVEDGKLGALPQTGLTISGSGTNKLSVVGSTTALNAYFIKAGNLTYLTAPNNNSARTLTTTVSDGSLSGSDTSLINITAVNDAPTVTAPTTFTVTEDVAGNLVYTGTPFVDVDSPNLTVTLSIADGVINAQSLTGLTITGGGSAKVTISGPTSTLNTYFTKAGNITYTTALNNNVARVLTTSVSDGLLTASATSTINITPVNDAPVVTAPASFTVTEDVAGNLVFGATTFADVDSSALTVTLSIADGTITTAAGAGLTLGGTATARTISGTITNLNNYFKTAGNIKYTTFLNNTTSRTLSIKAADSANGIGSATSTIQITPVNDKPTLTSVQRLNGASPNTPFEITYAMLLNASDAKDVDGDVISFRIQTVTTGRVEKFNGTTWIAVVPGTTLLSPNEKIRWTPANNANGILNAFTVLAWDGALNSDNPAVQVKIGVSLA